MATHICNLSTDEYVEIDKLCNKGFTKKDLNKITKSIDIYFAILKRKLESNSKISIKVENIENITKIKANKECVDDIKEIEKICAFSNKFNIMDAFYFGTYDYFTPLHCMQMCNDLSKHMSDLIDIYERIFVLFNSDKFDDYLDVMRKFVPVIKLTKEKIIKERLDVTNTLINIIYPICKILKTVQIDFFHIIASYAYFFDSDDPHRLSVVELETFIYNCKSIFTIYHIMCIESDSNKRIFDDGLKFHDCSDCKLPPPDNRIVWVNSDYNLFTSYAYFNLSNRRGNYRRLLNKAKGLDKTLTDFFNLAKTNSILLNNKAIIKTM